MIYSVPRTGAGVYDYYETPNDQPTLNVEKPTHLPAGRALGIPASAAGWPLPSNAKKIGSGADAIGRVASPPGGAAALGDIAGISISIGPVLIVGGLAYLLWKSAHGKRATR